MQVFAALARALAERQVDTVFGVLGDGNLQLVDQLTRGHGVRFVAVNREDGAVAAADAYARVSGRMGVATVTHGPGLTNAITPLHEAARARTPVLLLAGDTDPQDRAHNQRIDQRATTAPTGAAFWSLRSATTALEDLDLAVSRAWTERLPVVLDLPVQHQKGQTDWRAPRLVPETGVVHPDPDQLDRALGLLASSRRPLVLAGWGIVESGGRNQAIRLAEALRAPLATTLKAQGLFGGESFDLGVFGTLSSTPASETIGQADLVVALGASLNPYTTAYGAMLDGKRVIQVDVAPNAIGHWSPVDVEVVGDATVTADRMADALESLGEPPPGLRSPELAGILDGHRPEDEFVETMATTGIDPRSLMIWLDRTFPRDRTLVIDVGGFMETPLRYLGVAEPRAHVLPADYGAVGLSGAAAVGAGMAAPHRPVLAVTGDGGFMMGGMNEFETAVRLGLDLTVVVLNNSGYGIEARALEAIGGTPSLAEMAWPDIAALARALGGAGITIRSLKDLPTTDALMSETRPLVIDAHMPPGF